MAYKPEDSLKHRDTATFIVRKKNQRDNVLFQLKQVNEKVLLFFSSCDPQEKAVGRFIRAFECVSFPGSIKLVQTRRCE